VQVEVQAAYLGMFPKGDALFVPRVFGWAITCFTGGYDNYQPIDARYHDFEHTLQGTLCFARLLHGRQKANAQPALTQRMFQLGLIAILMHDTGYLKKREDTNGTGAKYTVTHVERSAEFAGALLKREGFAAEEIKSVQNMIHCTLLATFLLTVFIGLTQAIIVGFALGTSDLLGQMAAEDYVEKLPILYAEFAEATQFSKDKPHLVAMFSSAADLMQKTPAFWEKYVQIKLKRDFGGLYRFLNDPYPSGPNYYWDRIDANIYKLRQQLGSVRS